MRQERAREVCEALAWAPHDIRLPIPLGSRFLRPHGDDYVMTEDGWKLVKPYYHWLGKDGE